MSLENAVADLRIRCRDLAQAATELVTIVHEDGPNDPRHWVVDQWYEIVSELQAYAVQAQTELDRLADPRTLPARMGRIDAAVAECQAIYWRDLASYRPLAMLRRAAREHGMEWRTWQRSVELSLSRCELALNGAGASVRAAWREIGELLTHYTHVGAVEPWPDTSQTEVSTSTRRQS